MLELKAYAKINLFLRITGRRDDGYHTLETVLQTVDLFDSVFIEKAEELKVGGELPLHNTARTAAELFFAETGVSGGADIAIKKRIPRESGMGGGSADAAAVLTGLNALYGRPLSASDLCALGLRIGSDVPFFFTGGCMLAEGIGEKLTPIENNLDAYYLMLKPKRGVNTTLAYSEYERLAKLGERELAPCLDALKRGDFEAFGLTTCNSLGHAAMHICPETRALLKALENIGDRAYVLSGSGSTCVGLFRRQANAKKTQQQMLNWDLNINRIGRAVPAEAVGVITEW